MEKRLETKQMKLTKETLKRIIKEELNVMLSEAMPGMRGTNIRGDKYQKGDESFQALKRSVDYGDQDYGQFVSGVIRADFDTYTPSYSFELTNEVTGETFTGSEQGSQFEVIQMHNALRHNPEGKFDPAGLEKLAQITGVETNQLKDSLHAGKIKLDLRNM
mgnify:FL=1|jgi:hypothetical protein